MTEANETVVTPVVPKGGVREKIVDALMQLAAERKFEDIAIRDIAERANVTLGEFRDAFPSKGAVLGGFNRRMDRAVLDQNFDDMVSEAPRERLFDVLMRRLEAMAPYRDGLREIVAGLKRDPLAAAEMNRLIVNSMRFMLEAAGIANDGPTRAVKLQGLALGWARIVGVWLEDDDPGFAHTMAVLDRELIRGERAVRVVDWLDSVVGPLRRLAIDALEAGARIGERRRARPEADDKRDV
jgi:AcrR family transcriptional regulator